MNDWPALAAHELRELMEKAADWLSPDKVEHSSDWQLLANLKRSYDDCKGTSKCYVEKQWEGEIDSHLADFMGEIDTSLRRHDKKITRQDQAKSMFGSIDQDQSDKYIKIWLLLRKKFVELCHHKNTYSPDQFEECLVQLEQVLPAVFAAPSADMEELCRIIAKGPNAANVDRAVELIRKGKSQRAYFLSSRNRQIG